MAIFLSNWRNISYEYLFRRLHMAQDTGPPSNNIRRTCHLGGLPSHTIWAQHCLTSVIKWVLVCPTWQDAVLSY
jgi:hypothetical protein